MASSLEDRLKTHPELKCFFPIRHPQSKLYFLAIFVKLTINFRINKNSAEIKADFDAMDVADYAKAVKLEGVDDGYDLDNLDMRDRVYDSEDSDKAPLGQLFGDVKLYETSDSDDSSMDVGQSYNNAGPSIVAGPSRKTDFAKKTKNLKKKSAKDDSSKTTRKLDFSPKQSKKKTSQKKQTPEPVYDEDMR